MTDKSLEQCVRSAFDWEPSLDANDIGVSVDEGIVTLRGYVGSYAQKMMAEQVVLQVYGVRAVANDIDVHPMSGFQRTDTALAQAAVAALTWNTKVPSDRVTVTIADGWLTLNGMVDWQYQKDAAARAVRDLPGVKGVANNIVLHPLLVGVRRTDPFWSGGKHMGRISTLALVVSLIGVTKSEASLIWSWSFAGETGQFVTDGVTPDPGIYTLEDFIVTSSSAGGTIGSIRSGEYSASGFGTVPPYAMTWNGHEVTFWDSAGDNAADWWPFSDLVNGSYEDPFGQLVCSRCYLFAWDSGNVNDPTRAALWDAALWYDTREPLTVGDLTVTPIPEPSTWLLLSSGLVSAGARWRVKRRG